MKRCARCREWKGQTAFSADKSRKDGLQPYCKACNRAYLEANTERISARKQQHYTQNADRLRQRSRDHLSANRDQVNARRRELHAARSEEKNAERRRQYALDSARVLDKVRSARRANIERSREHERARYAANPERYKAQARNRKARKKGAQGKYTAAEWRALKAQYRHTCLRCGRSEPDIKLTPDHIVPLARGGSNYITNLQPLCLECNLWKSTKIIDFRPIS